MNERLIALGLVIAAVALPSRIRADVAPPQAVACWLALHRRREVARGMRPNWRRGRPRLSRAGQTYTHPTLVSTGSECNGGEHPCRSGSSREIEPARLQPEPDVVPQRHEGEKGSLDPPRGRRIVPTPPDSEGAPAPPSESRDKDCEIGSPRFPPVP